MPSVVDEIFGAGLAELGADVEGGFSSLGVVQA